MAAFTCEPARCAHTADVRLYPPECTSMHPPPMLPRVPSTVGDNTRPTVPTCLPLSLPHVPVGLGGRPDGPAQDGGGVSQAAAPGPLVSRAGG